MDTEIFLLKKLFLYAIIAERKMYDNDIKLGK